MSAPLTLDGIRFTQRTLCSAGCYAGPQDGIWSSALDQAEVKLLTLSTQIAAKHGQFDPRSEKNIATLHPAALRIGQVVRSRVATTGPAHQ